MKKKKTSEAVTPKRAEGNKEAAAPSPKATRRPSQKRQLKGKNAVKKPPKIADFHQISAEEGKAGSLKAENAGYFAVVAAHIEGVNDVSGNLSPIPSLMDSQEPPPHPQLSSADEDSPFDGDKEILSDNSNTHSEDFPSSKKHFASTSTQTFSPPTRSKRVQVVVDASREHHRLLGLSEEAETADFEQQVSPFSLSPEGLKELSFCETSKIYHAQDWPKFVDFKRKLLLEKSLNTQNRQKIAFEDEAEGGIMFEDEEDALFQETDEASASSSISSTRKSKSFPVGLQQGLSLIERAISQRLFFDRMPYKANGVSKLRMYGRCPDHLSLDSSTSLQEVNMASSRRRGISALTAAYALSSQKKQENSTSNHVNEQHTHIQASHCEDQSFFNELICLPPPKAMLGCAVFSIDWNSSSADLLAAAYGRKWVNPQASNTSNLLGGGVALWSLKNLLNPLKLMKTRQGGVSCVQFASQNPHLLAAGLQLGKIALWDLRDRSEFPVYIESSSKSETTVSTEIDAHTDCVMDLQWVKDSEGALRGFQKQAELLFTTSLDGTVAMWDLSKGIIKSTMQQLHDTPVRCDDYLKINASSANEESLSAYSHRFKFGSATCLSFKSDDSSSYLLGTEGGQLHHCSTLSAEKSLDTFTEHTAAVNQLSRNYFNPNVYLSCSDDWKVALWYDSSKRPIYLWNYNTLKCPIHSVQWDPMNSTGFAVATDVGRADYYDIHKNKLEPLFSYYPPSISSSPIYCLRFSKAFPALAMAAGNGKIVIASVASHENCEDSKACSYCLYPDEKSKLDGALLSLSA